MAHIPNMTHVSGQILDAIEQELWRIGAEIEAKAVEYLDRKQVNVTGDLRKSISSEVKRELGTIRLTVGSNMKYGVFVHEGTRPHWPPEKPIRLWVVKKLGITGKEVKKVTGAVRYKIAKKGTKARPFLGVPFRLYRNVIAKRIAERVGAIA